MTADEAANKTLVLKVLTEPSEDRDGSAIDRYYTGRLVQHNPLFPDGTDELRERVTASTDVRHQTSMVAADGDIVMVYGRYEGVGLKPMIAVDIYRIEDGASPSTGTSCRRRSARRPAATPCTPCPAPVRHEQAQAEIRQAFPTSTPARSATCPGWPSCSPR